MKTKLCIGIALLTATWLRAQTNDLTTLLQQGLFEEQANRNLDAAIADYQSLALQFDRDRQLAATAVFRLGECYRAQGRTNEAAVQYQRIMRDFPDQQTLATLSRQDLAGMGMSPAPAASVAAQAQEAVDLLEKQIDLAEQDAADAERRFQTGTGTQADVRTAKREVLSLQQQLAALKSNSTGLSSLSLPAANPDVQLWNKLKDMPRDELEQVLPTVLPDRALDSLLQQRNEAIAKMAQLTNDYALSSAECMREKSLIDELNRQTGQRISGMMQGLKLRAELSANAPTTRRDEKEPIGASAGSDEDREIQRLQQMIQNSPDLITGPNAGELNRAANSGELRVATFLLDHGTDPNSKQNGKTALDAAAENAQKSMVELLLSRGADVNTYDDSGGTALLTAADSGFQAVVEVLVAHKADVNARYRDNGDDTPLHRAALRGHQGIVSQLLEQKAEVDPQNKRGETPLFMAVRERHETIVSLLLAAGANPNLENSQGRTMLSFAVENGPREVVKALLAAKADPSGGKLDAPLLVAIHKKDVAATELLLQAGANPNAKGLVDWQITIGNTEFSNGSQCTPMFLSAYTGQLAMVQLLLKYKADPNDTQTDNQSVLFSALDKPEIVRALLDAGAAAEATNFLSQGSPQFGPPQNPIRFGGGTIFHNTLLQEAARLNQPETVALLLQHGANPAACDEAANSALHEAAIALSDEKVFISLLDHQANPNVRNSVNKTPLDIIKEASQDHLNWPARFGSPAGKIAHAEKLIALLRQHGALDNLPNWDRITISRQGGGSSQPVFYQNSNHWNHFTLLECLLQASDSGAAGSLLFPDLAHIFISRPGADGRVANRIIVSLLDATNDARIDFAHDVPLKFGDNVEIPEREHTLAEAPEFWTGNQWQAIHDHFRDLAGQAKLVVAGGQTVQIPLEPFHSAIGSLLQLGIARAALTSNSDLSRVKVIRHDPQTNQTEEWTLDCNIRKNEAIPDLWLRAGDVIEVPEK